MSQKGNIVITFNRSALNGETISFFRKQTSSLATVELLSTFVTTSRTQNNQIPINNPLPTLGEAEAIAYVKYFNVDNNIGNLMTISRVSNVVTIEINLAWSLETFTTTTGATSSITGPVPETFTLTQASLTVHPTTPCDLVDVEITTSQQAFGYSYALGNAPIITVTTNPFKVPVTRTIPTKIYVHKSGSPTLDVAQLKWGDDYIYIRKIFPAGFKVLVLPNPLLGATVTTNIFYPNQLSQQPIAEGLVYSLNNSNFQASNIFTGQTDGDYTMYVKDSLGCTVQKDYTVSSSSSSREPFVFVSDLNSIGFAESQIWNGTQDGINKNPENVLAKTDTQDILFDERLIFREEDNVRIQFKSNFDSNLVKMQNCEGNDISRTITVEKMSNNMNLFEALDAEMYSYGPGLTAIYFLTGNIYNEAGVVTGTYDLNGNLPDFAYIGNTVDIQIQTSGTGGVHVISDILYDETIEKRVIIFEYGNLSTNPLTVTARSYYDILNFEVYEFNVDFNNIVIQGGLEPTVRLKLTNTDNLYDTKNYYSNWIEIIKTEDDYDLNKYVSINYSNNNNRSVFYIYGIKHFIRAEILFSNSTIDDSVQVIRGDTNTYLSESIVHSGMNISFAEVTYKVMMKISLALSSENLFVNGLGYVKESNLEIEPILNTNLYRINVTLLRSRENFNSFINSNIGNDESYRTLYIPGLTKTNLGGSIKI